MQANRDGDEPDRSEGSARNRSNDPHGPQKHRQVSTISIKKTMPAAYGFTLI